MNYLEFRLTQEYIELIRLMKLLRISESGGQAKMMVDDGIVTLNGALETRYRAKLREGDQIEIKELGYSVKILPREEAI